ncbi:MAG: electron transport complex subunit E [Porticoccaceae bacterium]|jgi:electron transport complex protein RnfE|nr:electron transport complex subunit E [Porticoccaceae bacterium]MBT5004390.1 electron transport complex subunit E [Porticoccaceae bacterium]MBT5103835.1 electron transport complex subunit E [Porticoccaceae bacterium]MBT6027966.1 electron transport complex subunit E [Porticoccaceae bacterium]MBT6421569.1 electron transport complex subunit E [Porticoccaceae bacterium]
MSDTTAREVTENGLWHNNPALVQLLGLCPLLAVSSTVANALGLGLATMMVLIGSNTIVSLIRNHVNDAVRLPVFVIIIATFVTCAELLMKAYTYDLYQILGIFVPLIVTNCAILGRAEAFASKNNVSLAALDGFMMGMGFLLVLVALGAIRELLGQGTLFLDMHLLFGPIAANWLIQPFGPNYSFLIIVLPPGAFLVTGLLIALKNIIDNVLRTRADESRDKPIKGAKRVRTTGHIS